MNPDLAEILSEVARKGRHTESWLFLLNLVFREGEWAALEEWCKANELCFGITEPPQAPEIQVTFFPKASWPEAKRPRVF